MQTLFIIVVLVIVLPIIALILTILNDSKKKRQREQELEEERQALANNELAITPERLMRLREQQKGFTGVYIIYNKTKDLVYVGQAQNVYVRCSNHFLGKGNADIYADYKYGDDFKISFESLINSGYDRLDTLERIYIARYDATNHGYNILRGNK